MYGLLVSLSLLCLYSLPSSGVASENSKSVFIRSGPESRHVSDGWGGLACLGFDYGQKRIRTLWLKAYRLKTLSNYLLS